MSYKKVGITEIITGIILAVLGIVCFVYPDHSLTGIVVIYGIVAVACGIFETVIYIRVERMTGISATITLISGVLSVMAGVMLIMRPSAGKWILSILFPLWFIAHCVSRLSHLNFVRFMAGNTAFYLTMILNIAGLVLGFVMLFNPSLSLTTFSVLAGISLLDLGIDELITGIMNLKNKSYPDMF